MSEQTQEDKLCQNGVSVDSVLLCAGIMNGVSSADRTKILKLNLMNRRLLRILVTYLVIMITSYISLNNKSYQNILTLKIRQDDKLYGRYAMLAMTATRQNNMCQMWHKLNDFKWNCKNCKKNHKV